MTFFIALEIFLITAAGCFVALCAFYIFITMEDRQISIKDFYKNVELSYFSLIFERAKHLRASGMTDDEIVERVRFEYDNKIFRFLQYEVTKDDYLKALQYVSLIVHDNSKIEPLKNYVICPDFGKKKFFDMKKALADDGNINLAKNALKNLLKDESMDNVNSVMAWFPELFINPVLNPIHPERDDSKSHLISAIYYAITTPNDGYEPIFKENVKLELFGEWMKALELISPKALTIAHANISRYRHKVVDLPEWKDWKQAIWKRINDLKPNK